jgi:ParB-like chromosome segregation protein Spo0J
MRQPIDEVEWVDPAQLRANDYNPNRVFSPEMALLKRSILENGWTQPVVATSDGTIVDGFHRWTLASSDADIIAFSKNLVPCVRVEVSRAAAMAATVRHNRARGKHGVLKMADIVTELACYMPHEEIQEALGMEMEEVVRLLDASAAPQAQGRDSYGKGWIPGG